MPFSARAGTDSGDRNGLTSNSPPRRSSLAPPDTSDHLDVERTNLRGVRARQSPHERLIEKRRSADNGSRGRGHPRLAPIKTSR